MKYLSILAIAATALTAGCSYTVERTVVERPVPASTVYYAQAPTTYYSTPYYSTPYYYAP